MSKFQVITFVNKGSRVMVHNNLSFTKHNKHCKLTFYATQHFGEHWREMHQWKDELWTSPNILQNFIGWIWSITFTKIIIGQGLVHAKIICDFKVVEIIAIKNILLIHQAFRKQGDKRKSDYCKCAYGLPLVCCLGWRYLLMKSSSSFLKVQLLRNAELLAKLVFRVSYNFAQTVFLSQNGSSSPANNRNARNYIFHVSD